MPEAVPDWLTVKFISTPAKLTLPEIGLMVVLNLIIPTSPAIVRFRFVLLPPKLTRFWVPLVLPV